MSRKGNSKALCIFLTLLALFLAGTVVVLSTVVVYFGVDWHDVITEPEMARFERLAAQASNLRQQALIHPNAPVSAVTINDSDLIAEEDEFDTAAPVRELDSDDEFDDQLARIDERALNSSASPEPRIPRIIHQTWKTDTLPERWAEVRQGCVDLHPDYEYMLWSDASSREFIAKEYPWFLSTFDGYVYPIQRADAIRYFVLHHYGGIYMDLDIGCKRSMDPLLYFQVILPATIPVGVSNDLMFAEKGHPFMDLVIHNLVTFDHQYGTNYPTVMFSTGPMFLSAQYGLWPKEDPNGSVERQVRILPRKWYGKNAPVAEEATSYFTHFYGSSWHADDAGFITFLGKFGMILMYLGLTVVVLGAARIAWSKRSMLKTSATRPAGAIALPFHADGLPFTRPGTPSSRPGSPFNPYRPGDDLPSPVPRGFLYYVPVWLLSPGAGPNPAGPATPGGWTSFLPGMQVDDGQQTGYQPLPNFSRPGSPNNSILHGAGQHDGAFDGVPLHSIDRSGSSPYAKDTHSSSSAPPPAYSALRTWGSQFFRGNQPTKDIEQQQQQHQQPFHAGHRKQQSSSASSALGLGLDGAAASQRRSVSPRPATLNLARPTRQSSPIQLVASPTDYTQESASSPIDPTRGSQGSIGHAPTRGRPSSTEPSARPNSTGSNSSQAKDASRSTQAQGGIQHSSGTRTPTGSSGRGGSGRDDEFDLDEYESQLGQSGQLENEVDKLLEEMEPDA